MYCISDDGICILKKWRFHCLLYMSCDDAAASPLVNR